jgi:MoaA/NifB/PqqE/SkfB family radical SAM enzyme
MEKENIKAYYSDGYNYIYNKTNGLFMRWGKTLKNDPIMAPSPEIADIEISSGGGVCKGKCVYCYKENNKDSPLINMSLEQFKIILNKINTKNILTQIAFGIEDISTNPEFWDIIEYTRNNDITPNYTTNGFEINQEIAERTSKLCGAVAVSWHNPKVAMNAISLFLEAGMKQVNIHYVLAKETVDEAHKMINTLVENNIKVNAIVFLGYKHKNKNSPYHYGVNIEDYESIISHCKKSKIGFGFDSCSAPNFLKSIEGKEDEKMSILAEPCESTLFSSYINAKGEFFPCSFCEGTPGWETGINVIECKDFIKDIWMSERVISFRNKLIESSKKCKCKFSEGCRSCQIYPEVAWCKK